MTKAPQAGGVPHAEEIRREQLEQLDFEIGFFDHILARQPGSTDVLRLQGELLSRRGLHARALDADRKLVALRPRDARAHYNLACSLALSGRRDDALAELRQAVELGYIDHVHMEHDPDLDLLRDQPTYAEILSLMVSKST